MVYLSVHFNLSISFDKSRKTRIFVSSLSLASSYPQGIKSRKLTSATIFFICKILMSVRSSGNGILFFTAIMWNMWRPLLLRSLDMCRGFKRSTLSPTSINFSLNLPSPNKFSPTFSSRVFSNNKKLFGFFKAYVIHFSFQVPQMTWLLRWNWGGFWAVGGN